MSCQCPLLYVMAGLPLSRYCHVLPNYNCVLKHKCQKWREEEGVLEAKEHTMGGLFWKKFYHNKIADTLALPIIIRGAHFFIQKISKSNQGIPNSVQL